MGLKGYRLWVMGQLDSTCRAPPQATLHELVVGVDLSEMSATLASILSSVQVDLPRGVAYRRRRVKAIKACERNPNYFSFVSQHGSCKG
jgi:hypothetical protein